jgi:Tol biopolymer transport system component
VYKAIVIFSAIAVLVFLAAAAFTASGQSLPAVPYGFSWSYLETEHFRVLHHQGSEPLARRAASIAELVHRRLTKFLSWQPKDKTRLIILDNTDQANAMASAFPRNTIIVHPVPPSGEPGNYLDWLYEILLHEYAHIIQADMVTGFMSDLRSVFGRIVVPNAIQPINQVEGLAVYAESRYSSLGRNNSALTEGILRTAALEGDWPTVDRVAVFNTRWPWDAPYLFGGKFTQFLADSFCQNSLGLYQLAHSSLVLPFMQNRPAKKIYGNSFPELWSFWSGKSNVIYRHQADSIIKGVGSRILSLTSEDGLYKSALALSPDERFLLYYRNDGSSHPGIVMMELDTGRRKTVHKGYVDGAISFSLDGGSVFFGQVDLTNDGRETSSDLYRLDLFNRKLTRLTRGWRARDPAPSPDGRCLYFVTTRLGQGALCRLKLDGLAVDTLVGFEDSSAISCPAVSPDGRLLAFSAWTGEGYQDIYLYDLENGGCRPIITDRAQDIQPRWSADGGNLFFSSDRSGVWNIYRWDKSNGKIYQLTQQIGGSFWPTPGRERLWTAVLGGRGYDIAWIELRNQNDVSVESFRDNYFISGEIAEYSGQLRPYHFWKSLFPVAWLPAGFIDYDGGHLGAMAFGADDLMRHLYAAALAPGRSFNRCYHRIQYQSTAWPLNIYALSSDYVVIRNSEGSSFYLREKEYLADFTKTFASFSQRLSFGFGYRLKRITDDCPENQSSNPFWTGRLADVILGLSYSNAKRYLRSIGPEDGRVVALSTRLYRRSLGGDVDQSWDQLEWKEYRPLPLGDVVLAAAAKMGLGRSRGAFLDELSNEFTIRGFDDDPFGRIKLRTTVEARIPIVCVERGRGTWPVFLTNVHGALFYEAGWGGRRLNHQILKEVKRSLGIELKADWKFFYALGLQSGFGLALPLGEKSRLSPYVTISTSLDMFHDTKVH